jgi:hypothetical protein
VTTRDLLNALLVAKNDSEAAAAVQRFVQFHGEAARWVPLGRSNNRGTVEASSDPGRSLVERMTNGIDAVLEAEHDAHKGVPDCRSPKEAAAAWLNVPEAGLSAMTPAQRRALAQRVTVRVLEGSGREARVVEVRDTGTGLAPAQMAGTILSLSETNKVQKLYLAGAYGQGGSSTFAVSKSTLIASRGSSDPRVGFTVVMFQDLPPDQYKIGRYVYLTLNGGVLEAEVPLEAFPTGTLVRHFGYDLTNYDQPLGPSSVYGLLNQTLFDPVMPVWLDNRVENYRRVIKGSRNALNGAVDDGDDDTRGPRLAHNVPLFYSSLGDFGRIAIEYWVLERPTKKNKRPSGAFVNPNKPIVLTLNGQSHAELPVSVIRKGAELQYLAQRLVCHIDCDSLTPAAKRALFVSNREEARRGQIYDLIEQEVVSLLKSDDELVRLNNEAREQGLKERDEGAVQRMRTEVARLLRLQGVPVAEGLGGQVAEGDTTTTRDRPVSPPKPRPPLQPIEPHEPPTYIRLVWDPERDITFHPQQRRYIRLETDANATYHTPDDPKTSRINVIVEGEGVGSRGSTPLRGGRMRAIFEGASDAGIGRSGKIRVELTRTGLPTLSDERHFRIVATPPEKPAARRVTLPQFELRAVAPDDQRWTDLAWPEDVNLIASSAQTEDGILVIYYSTAYPPYAARRASFERRDPATAASFDARYGIWLVVHSLMVQRDQQPSALEHRPQAEGLEELAEDYERQERCRVAMMAAMVAAHEVHPGAESGEGD